MFGGINGKKKKKKKDSRVNAAGFVADLEKEEEKETSLKTGKEALEEDGGKNESLSHFGAVPVHVTESGGDLMRLMMKNLLSWPGDAPRGFPENGQKKKRCSLR